MTTIPAPPSNLWSVWAAHGAFHAIVGQLNLHLAMPGYHEMSVPQHVPEQAMALFLISIINICWPAAKQAPGPACGQLKVQHAQHLLRKAMLVVQVCKDH